MIGIKKLIEDYYAQKRKLQRKVEGRRKKFLSYAAKNIYRNTAIICCIAKANLFSTRFESLYLAERRATASLE